MILSQALQRLELSDPQEKEILVEWAKELEGLISRQASHITAQNEALIKANAKALRYYRLHNKLGKKFAASLPNDSTDTERLKEIEHRVRKLKRAIHDGRTSDAIVEGAIWVTKALAKKEKE